ncbi:MAG: type IV toxin-antitoxin system AbiEi family antitoxin [Gammaproteobacteria bacterium]|nr:type IV toxin-antitoxin system AbiEi family antitoxin [Gammaproteobacteria bacterium]
MNMKPDNHRSLLSYIEALQSRGRYYFELIEASNAMNKSTAAFNLALHRLVKKGRIKRIRSGFYIIVPFEYSSVGCLPASWFINPFMRSMKLDYYVGLLSAADYHGAAHQQVMTFQVMTNKPMRPIKIGKVRIDFHYRKNIPSQLLQSVKTETGEMMISSPELTACDLIKYINLSGQIHNVATVLFELQHKININSLIEYLDNNLISTTHIQRLGYILEYIKSDLDTSYLHKWLSHKKVEYVALAIGSRSEVIEKNNRWHILVNEKVEIDL